MSLTRLVLLTAILVCSSGGASGQVHNLPAPPTNVQALEITGAPLTGEDLQLSVTGTPGAGLLIGFSTASASISHPAGQLLIDPSRFVVLLVEIIPASGVFTLSFPVLALPVGIPFYGQAAIFLPGVPPTLTNLSTINVVGALQISILSPATGGVFNTPTPTAVISYSVGADLSTLVVIVDGLDITGSLIITPTGAQGTLDSLASPLNGPHNLHAHIESPTGIPADATSTFTVSTPISGAPATVTGRVLDPAVPAGTPPAPIVGVQLFFAEGGTPAFTDSTGTYVITDPPIGVNLHLQVDPATATSSILAPGNSYPAYIRSITVFEGTTSLQPPIFLPQVTPIDTLANLEQLGLFSCAESRFIQRYLLSNPTLGISVEFTPDTYLEFEGNPPPAACSVSLSIAEVDLSHPPSQLPAFFNPGVLGTLQPTLMNFWDGPPSDPNRQRKYLAITLPNSDNAPNGTELDFYTLDHDAGVFVRSGRLRAQGANLVTISGGIPGGTWHGGLQLPPGGSGSPPPNGCGPNASPNPVVQLETGFILETLSLPKRRLFNLPYGPDLVYSSAGLAGNEIARLNVDFDPAGALPGSVSVSARLAGIPIGTDWFSTSGASLASKLRLPFVFDTSALPPGVYPYVMEVRNNFAASSASTFIPGEILVRSSGSGMFGRGWSLSHDSRLSVGPAAGHLLIEDGSGHKARFLNSVLLSEEGLNLRMYPQTSVSAMTSFHATTAPTPFIRRRAAQPPETVTSAVIPNAKFWNAGGPYLLHVGVDGVQQTTTLTNPRGDDIVFEAPGGEDAFGVLIEGFLSIPETADITFAVFADDAFALEISDQLVATLSGVNPSGIVAATRNLPAGPARFRLAYADLGGFSHLWVTASGGGFPGGVIPAGENLLFTGAGGPSTAAVATYSGIQGEFSTVTRLADGSWRRNMAEGGHELFDSAGHIGQRVDRNGRTTTFVRNAIGHIQSMIDPAGGATSLSYSGGKVTSVTDAAGRTTQFVYAGNDLIIVIDAVLGQLHYAYDNSGLLISQTNADGMTNTHEYDSMGRYLRTVYPDGNSQSARPAEVLGLGIGSGSSSAAVPVQAPGLQSTHVDELGHATTVIVDHAARTVAGRNQGQRIYTDALGRVTRVYFDVQTELPVELIKADQTRVFLTWEFNRGFLLSRIDEGDPATASDDRRTDFAPDPLHPMFSWLLSRTVAVGTPQQATTIIIRDANGNPIAIHDPLMHSRSFQYGPLGVLSQIVDESGRITDLGRDPTSGNTTSVTVNGRTVTYAHDAAGNISAVNLPTNVGMSYAWDPTGRLLSVTNDLGGLTSNSWSPAGLLLAATDAKGATTGFMHDGRGRLLHSIDPLGQMESFDYLGNGLLNSYVDRNGVTTTLTYDAGDRLTSFQDPMGQTAFAYDLLDHRLSIVNGAATISRSYTPLGDLQTETVVAGGITSAISSNYDATGHRTDVALNIGATPIKYTSYSRDLAGHLTALQEIVSDPTLPAASLSYFLAYDPAGRRIELNRPENIQSTYAYDADGFLNSTTTTMGTSQVTHDTVGYNQLKDISSINEMRTLLQNNSSLFMYDSLRRLLQEQFSAPGLPLRDYTRYDHVGNRNSGTYTFDNSDHLLATGAAFFDYDPVGNVVSRRPTSAPLPRRAYQYDPQGQLMAIIDFDMSGVPTQVGSYAYDGFGRRILRNGIRYVYDKNAIAATIAPGGARSVIVHRNDIDEPLATVDVAGVTHLIPDALGSIVQTIRNGMIVSERRYDAFGNPLSTAGALSAPIVDYAYRSREWDSESSLGFNRARYYDPAHGRFLRREALYFHLVGRGSPQYAHPYTYALNNPMSYGDPMGLQSLSSGFGGGFQNPDDPVPNRDPNYCSSDAVKYVGGIFYCGECKAAQLTCECLGEKGFGKLFGDPEIPFDLGPAVDEGVGEGIAFGCEALTEKYLKACKICEERRCDK